MSEISASSPMMKQYLRFKAEHPDAILFFHLGDFYEVFFEDAATVAKELDVVLTSRNGHPMAGVPVRRGEVYVAQLLRRGYKVAVCQQVEDPKKATGLVRREIVRVLTPGTAIDDAVLDAGSNHYLAAVLESRSAREIGLAYLDLSTGEFVAASMGSLEALRGELERLGPAEVLLPVSGSEALVRAAGDRLVTRRADAEWTAEGAECRDPTAGEAALQAAAAILAYVRETQGQSPGHLRPLRVLGIAQCVDLDAFTVSSLELVRPLRDGKASGTLLHVLDRTMTPLGRRLLRRRLLAPLTDRSSIERRLDAIGTLVRDVRSREALRAALSDVHDAERLVGKLGAGRLRPLDLVLLTRSLAAIDVVAQALTGVASAPEPAQPTLESPSPPPAADDLLASLRNALGQPVLAAQARRFASLLVDQPPAEIRDGGAIRDGWSQDLDAMRLELAALRDRLTRLESEERTRTGIASLKVGYNRVFGYYLEVTRPHLSKVPPDYVRRQTLANAERFVTEELKTFEGRIAAMEEKILALEADLFDAAVLELRASIPEFQAATDVLAELDVLQSLADVAHRQRYVRPTFTTEPALDVRGGRHPVVERREEFVPNDLVLPEGKDLVVLTGPNMAGKSVFLRQTALHCIMAQLGSFVPADRAVLPLVDRVFARVGASDMLAAGVSTFMMEMLETASILDHATSRSLILFDEMGRGTSTFDGVSIAWAVAEHLARHVRAKTLFATHYQELTRLADELPNVVNLHVAVRELGKDVVFLHRVEPGTAAGSYGVHVARLAGLPDAVTQAADRVLDGLLAEGRLSQIGASAPPVAIPPLFGTDEHPVLKALRKIDVERLTPIEALQKLDQLRRQLDA
ncbi:MAG: DNA mismatch repair protein MutS [Candidatus Bipolaricaulota bacterium]